MVVILDRRFNVYITYYDSLHGLWARRGTGSRTLEVKMIQQVTSMREAVLYAIFLYLHKAYDTLDSSRCLDILDVYVVGPRSFRLLCRYREELQMVARPEG